MTRRARGPGPLNPGERWCGRLIRKSTRQAGCPDPLDVCPVHSFGVAAEVSRLSYQLRKRRVPRRAFAGLKRLRSLLVALVPRLRPPPAAPVVPAPVLTPPVVFPSDSRRHGLGYHTRPVNFVSGGLLQPEVPRPFAPRWRSRPSGGVLRDRWPSGLASDPRVAGTFLEGPISRARRARRAAAAVQVVVGPSSGLVRAKRAPSPHAKISTFELSAAMGTMKNKETDAFVEEVRKQAPPDLAALLAGEDWGVLKF